MKYTQPYLDFLNELDTKILTPKNIREVVKDVLEKHHEILKSDGEISYKYFLLESENIHISKSVSTGFSPMMSGTKKNEKGQDVETIWPDYQAYDQTSHDYFFDRFKNSTNKFLKCNYGLTVYIGGNLKHNRDKHDLVQSLFDVAQHTLKVNRDSKRTYKDFFIVSDFLRNAFDLAAKYKIMSKVDDIIKFVRAQFDSLTPNDDEYYTFFYLLTDLYTEHKKDIDKLLDVRDFINKIESDSQLLSQEEDFSGALILARKGLIIVEKYNNIPNKAWQKRIGKLLELVGDKEIERGNKFGCTNYQQAGEYYKAAGESMLEKAVISKYEFTRGRVELGLVSSNLSNSEVDDLENWIDSLVDKKNPVLIFSLWTLRTNITPINDIWTNVENAPDSFLDRISSHTINKFGDISEKYDTDSQNKVFKFWQEFIFSFQLSSKIAFRTTVKAIKMEVISGEDLIGFLRSTWLNEPIIRMYQGNEVSIVPNDIIVPAVSHFFNAFKEFALGNKNTRLQDFVTPIDSMTLKIETILRYALERMGFNTTVLAKSSNGFLVSKYKTLGQIFRELEEGGLFDEMDMTMFRFLFVIPEQNNYRNDIAHGVFDLHQYNPRTGLVILGAIVRLAMMDFKVVKEIVKR